MNRKDAHTQMIHELERLQEEMSAHWLDHSLPADWNGLDFWDDVKRKKDKGDHQAGCGHGGVVSQDGAELWTSHQQGAADLLCGDRVGERLGLSERPRCATDDAGGAAGNGCAAGGFDWGKGRVGVIYLGWCLWSFYK